MKRLGKMEFLMISVLMIVLILITVILFYVRDVEQQKTNHITTGPETEHSGNEYHPLPPSLQENSDFNNQADKISVNPFYPDDLAVQLTSDEGKLLEQQPFGNQAIKTISILVNTREGKKTFSVPPENYNILLQALYSVDLSLAKANISVPTGEGTIYMRFHAEDTVYSVPYDLDSNTYKFGEKRYYATYNTLAYLNLFCRPETILARIGEMRAIDLGTEDMPNYGTDQSVRYPVNRLKVQGQDIEEWSKEIEGNPDYEEGVSYYSIRNEKLKTIRVNENRGILFTGTTVFFLKGGVETADGITMGTSMDEVVSRLGAPNLKLLNKWSYQVDNERQFHLYFKEDKVKFITLTSQQ